MQAARNPRVWAARIRVIAVEYAVAIGVAGDTDAIAAKIGPTTVNGFMRRAGGISVVADRGGLDGEQVAGCVVDRVGACRLIARHRAADKRGLGGRAVGAQQAQIDGTAITARGCVCLVLREVSVRGGHGCALEEHATT